MADRLLAVFILALAGVYLAATTQVPVLEIGDPLGPRAFPYLVGVLAIVCAVWLLAESAARARAGEGEQRAAPGEAHHPLAVALVLAWMFGFYLVLETLGFIPATALFLLGLTSYFNRGRWLTNVLTSLLFPIGVYFAFTRVLSISLPHGVLPL